MDGKTQLIKNTVAKIDTDKIINYQQEYPKSKTLRQTANYIKMVQESNNEQEVVKLGTDLAYYLDVICDSGKGGYVKNTIGVKEKN